MNDPNPNVIFVHTSDGMHIRHSNQINWNTVTDLKNLSCYHIIAKQQNLGSVDIVSVPNGAKIFIDEIGDAGFTPKTISNISPGHHAYKLTYPGYTDVDGILFVSPNQTYQLSVIMVKTPEYFDPTKLFIYTLGIGLFMFFISKQKKEIDKENHKIQIKKTKIKKKTRK